MDSLPLSSIPTRRSYRGLQTVTVVLLILLSLTVPSCGKATPSITPTQPTATTQPSKTPIPTATDTPLPPLVILLAPPQADTGLASQLQSTLEGEITNAGLRWQVRQRLAPEDLVQELRLVIVLPPDPGIVELAASAPNTHFVAVGIKGLQPAKNLSVIGAQGVSPDQVGFLAGVIAAIITPDWRVGAISTSDTAGGVAARQGFVNGAIYFCGTCSPAYPPYYDYPLYVELPTGSTATEWQNAADYLLEHYVKTAYIYAEAGDETLRNYLAEKGVELIGSETPPTGLEASWVASLQPNLLPVISEALPALLSSESGLDLPTPLEINYINEELFSPGRQRLVNEILADLLAGYIGTGAGMP